MLKRLALLTMYLILQFRSKVSANHGHVPTKADFDTCKLSTEDKEKFVDEHNKFRGMVNPQAADMEYVVSKGILIGGLKLFPFSDLKATVNSCVS